MATLTAELMEQREQSDACIDSTESRQKKAEGQQIEQREQSDACIDSTESRQKKAEGQQIEQKKQLLIEKTREMKAIYDELVAAGAIELSDEQLNEINGGHWWEKVKEQAKKAAKEATDTGYLSLY